MAKPIQRPSRVHPTVNNYNPGVMSSRTQAEAARQLRFNSDTGATANPAAVGPVPIQPVYPNHGTNLRLRTFTNPNGYFKNASLFGQEQAARAVVNVRPGDGRAQGGATKAHDPYKFIDKGQHGDASNIIPDHVKGT